jgi:N-methylhydantoinase A
VLAELGRRCEAFVAGPGAEAVDSLVSYSVEARYPQQIWDLEVPLSGTLFESDAHVETLRNDFHRVHNDVLGIADLGSAVETMTWRAKVRCELGTDLSGAAPLTSADGGLGETREAYFSGRGFVEATVRSLASVGLGESVEGPAIIEGPATTVVVEPEASVQRLNSGSLMIVPGLP